MTYEINMFDHIKKKRILHVNMLKLWHPPATLNLWNEEVGEVEDVPHWRDQPGDAPTSREAMISDQLTEGQHQMLAALLLEYWEVMCPDPGRTTLVELHIDTGGANPIRLPPYRVPCAYRGAVADMLQAGIVETSKSSWAAPIVLVQKKDGTLCCCVDYGKLNAISKVDPYPMPRIDELLDKLGKAKFLATLDLSRDNWQVPMEKTAFLTPQGLFQFTTMPFGLQGAPATFQRMMDQLLSGLEAYTAAYLYR